MRRLLLTLGALMGSFSGAQSTPAVEAQLVGVPRVATTASLPIVLRLRNPTATPVFVPSGFPPEFDIVVTDAQGRVVRRRQVPLVPPEGVVGQVVIAPRGPTLGAGEALTVEWAWDLRDAQGQPVRTGRYCLVGTFQSPSEPLRPGLTSAPWCVWVLRLGDR